MNGNLNGPPRPLLRSASNCIFRHGRATAPCMQWDAIHNALSLPLESTDQYFSHMPDFASRSLALLDRTNLNFDSTRPVSQSVRRSIGRTDCDCMCEIAFRSMRITRVRILHSLSWLLKACKQSRRYFLSSQPICVRVCSLG